MNNHTVDLTVLASRGCWWSVAVLLVGGTVLALAHVDRTYVLPVFAWALAASAAAATCTIRSYFICTHQLISQAHVNGLAEQASAFLRDTPGSGGRA